MLPQRYISRFTRYYDLILSITPSRFATLYPKSYSQSLHLHISTYTDNHTHVLHLKTYAAKTNSPKLRRDNRTQQATIASLLDRTERNSEK